MEKLKALLPVAKLIPPPTDPAIDAPAAVAIQDQLNSAWPRCAGRAAMQSFPLLFRSGRLIVYTESAIWATELRHHSTAISDALQHLGVKKVDVRTTPRLFPQERRSRPKLLLSEKSRQNIAATARDIDHRELREALERLATGGEAGARQSAAQNLQPGMDSEAGSTPSEKS